jgi:hypothetical protein
LSADSIVTINFDFDIVGSGYTNVRAKLKLELLDGSDVVLTTVVKETENGRTEAGDFDIFDQAIAVDTFNFTTGRKVKLTYLALVNGTGISSSSLKTNSTVHYILYFRSPNSLYVEDSTSQSAYGIVHGKVEDGEITRGLNIINKSPTMSGTYSSGIHEGWSTWGTGTYTENTNLSYIRFGTKSQHCTFSGVASVGLTQAHMNLEAGRSYTLYLNLYIVTNNGLRIAMRQDGSGATFWGNQLIWDSDASVLDKMQGAKVGGVGWVEFIAENIVPVQSGSYRLVIWSWNSDTELYIDAAWLGYNQTEFDKFYGRTSADSLKEKAQQYLNKYKNPEIAYKVDLLDLYEFEPAIYNENKFTVGDTVKLQDSDFGIDSSLLVKRKEIDLLNPIDTKIVVSNAPDSIGDVLKKYGQIITQRTYS